MPGTVSKCNKCKWLPRYKPRFFKSKGAFLVLIWFFLVYCSVGSITGDFEELSDILLHTNYEYSTVYLYLQYIIPNIGWFVSALGSGFLADCRVGRYKVVRAGFIILWTGKVIYCSSGVVAYLCGIEHEYNSIVFSILSIVHKCFWYFGIAIIVVNTIQLGIEQLSDNPTEHITSFISWFVLARFAGHWINHALYSVLASCVFSSRIKEYKLVWSLIQVSILTAILCSDVALSHKFLTIDPKVPQSFKKIVQVLKFAAKNKRPIHRSAFTYWEDDIPSRIDLGKNKYGGPFTTEQVEDVKTVLRVLGLSIPLAVSIATFFSLIYYTNYSFIQNVDGVHFQKLPNLTECQETVMHVFVTFKPFWVVLGILVYEFAIYPLIRYRIPSMLKRIGFTVVTVTPYILIYFISIAIFYNGEGTVTLTWVKFPNSIWLAIRTILLTTAALEFFCAQVPQNMSGLAIGYLWFVLAFFSRIPVFFFITFVTNCSQRYCGLVYCIVAILTSIVSSVAFVALAHYYKKRERDERINQQWLVEDTYSRYIESYPQHSRAHSMTTSDQEDGV